MVIMSILTTATMPAMNAYVIILLISCRVSIMVPIIMNIRTAMNAMMHNIMLMVLIIWRMCSIFGFIAHILLLLYEISRYDSYFKRRRIRDSNPGRLLHLNILAGYPIRPLSQYAILSTFFLVDENNDNTWFNYCQIVLSSSDLFYYITWTQWIQINPVSIHHGMMVCWMFSLWACCQWTVCIIAILSSMLPLYHVLTIFTAYGEFEWRTIEQCA